MDVEKITIKVELGAWAAQAVAVLTDRECRSEEGAAAALCRELQGVLRDGVDAGVYLSATESDRSVS